MLFFNVKSTQTHRQPFSFWPVPVLALLITCIGHGGDLKAASASGCGARHIKEAIALNRDRAEAYAFASQEGSRSISAKILFLENLSLAPVSTGDLLAQPWQKQGIPLLCDDFIEMSTVPAFKAFDPIYAETCSADDPLPDTQALVERLQTSALKSYAALAGVVQDELDELSGFPARMCMTRHILQSIRRSAQLAPIYQREARIQGLSSPEALSNIFIFTQILFLKQAAEIDADLRAIHAQGIPFVCNDVPYIPPIYEEY